MKERNTSTSDFGSSGRSSHDSSRFYASRLYEGLEPGSETQAEQTIHSIEDKELDQIYHASSTVMHQLPDNSIHLMVTSPPYNASKTYDEDLSLDEYLDLLRQVFTETYRVLVPGGRACVNIANLGRKPYIPLNAFITTLMLECGFWMRGEIIWDKGSSAGSSTAWGSWMSASNPTLRDVHEYILVFSKSAFKRKKSDASSTIERDEFLEFTKSVWQFPTESATRIGHPAPFPVELPRRLIQLYTFEGDIVLDPFMGSGTTALACLGTGRKYIGYETHEGYIELANQRIKSHVND